LYFRLKNNKICLVFGVKLLFLIENKQFMKRDIYKYLQNWKNDNTRRPLLVRGARQVGKTYIINYFGNKDFANVIVLNFERNPEYKEIFTNLDPKEILERISLFTGSKITIGETLIFLDEIQECVEAIMSLRYFYEELPELHIIGAGSLLEFALNTKDLRMPVGRVQYLYMYPLSFREFLHALGEEVLYNYISDISNIKKIPDAIHNKLNELLRKYFLVGGMPAVVKDYVEHRDILKCQEIQHSLLETFIDDFSKYAKVSKYKYLRKVFYAVPSLIGRKFIYAKVDKTIKTAELKNAVELLFYAGIITKVKKTSGAGLPLEAAADNDYFKLIFLDIGLVHSISRIYTETAKQKDFTAIYNGVVAEQFVGQELLAIQNNYMKQGLYYWVRDARNSLAEIDYMIEMDDKIVPIEVKSGKKGTLKSLALFIDKYKSSKSYKVSQAKYNQIEELTELPFYGMFAEFGNK